MKIKINNYCIKMNIAYKSFALHLRYSPRKHSAFVAGYPFLQQVIKLASSITATSYPKGYS